MIRLGCAWFGKGANFEFDSIEQRGNDPSVTKIMTSNSNLQQQPVCLSHLKFMAEKLIIKISFWRIVSLEKQLTRFQPP